jgi:hypothetical protein
MHAVDPSDLDKPIIRALRSPSGDVYRYERDDVEVHPACIDCVIEVRGCVPTSRTVFDGAEAMLAHMGARDLSLRDVARNGGLPPGRVSRWLNGYNSVPPEQRPRLALGLEMSHLELEAILPRPGRRSRNEGDNWRCERHQTRTEDSA